MLSWGDLFGKKLSCLRCFLGQLQLGSDGRAQRLGLPASAPVDWDSEHFPVHGAKTGHLQIGGHRQAVSQGRHLTGADMS